MTTRAAEASEAGVQPWESRWIVGAMIVVSTLIAVGPWPDRELGPQLVAGSVLALLTVIAWRFRLASALRALVCLDVVWAIFALVGASRSPWLAGLATVAVCVVPLLCLLATNRVSWLRPAAPWWRRGQASAGLIAFGVVTVVLAGGALAAWATIVRPEPAPYLLGLQGLPLWLGILGILGFALVNPIWEEVVFRGVVLEELSRVWGTPAAIAAQAVLFGAAHWAGFPSGWIGMAMAAAWGAALGVIRVRSGGLALGYAVHVGANAVIGTLALVLLV